LFILLRSISIQNFMVLRWLVQVLHPPQKFERPPFWNSWRYGIKKYGVEVTFNGVTSLLNFIKIYQLVQKLLGGTHRQTDWWSHKTHFPLKGKGRLKTGKIFITWITSNFKGTLSAIELVKKIQWAERRNVRKS
jgi:hypothetical protein